MHSLYLYDCVYMCLTPAEKFWWHVSNTRQHIGEQASLNYALQDYGVKWNRSTNVKNLCGVLSGWQSYEPLNCMVFSQKDICRECCDYPHKHNYYIFHPYTKKVAFEKKKRAKKMNVWFLKYGWNKFISSSSEGTLWLRSVSTLNHA